MKADDMGRILDWEWNFRDDKIFDFGAVGFWTSRVSVMDQLIFFLTSTSNIHAVYVCFFVTE